jgi:hypothetical protein
MAFEQPGREVVAEQAGTSLALEECDQLILLAAGEHALKGIVGSGQPFLPQMFPCRARGRSRRGHR